MLNQLKQSAFQVLILFILTSPYLLLAVSFHRKAAVLREMAHPLL